MLNFKTIFRKCLSLFIFGFLLTAILSLGTFTGLWDSNIGTSAYLSALNSKSGQDILLISHSKTTSAFNLPGAQYELKKDNVGITNSFVISEITEDTYNEHVFSVGDLNINLNLVSYFASGDVKDIENCLGLNLIKGTPVTDFSTIHSFYISETTADFLVESISSISNYDDLLNREISYRGESFNVLGIFSEETSSKYKQVFDSLFLESDHDYSRDFIVAPFYLMNGGFFSRHNSLVLSMYGNESVFYHYLNFIRERWPQYSVSQTFYLLKNNSYCPISKLSTPLYLYSSAWLAIVFAILSFVLLFIAYIMLKHLITYAKPKGGYKFLSYFSLVLGMLISSLLFELINGKFLGGLFLYFSNYFTAIFEIASFIGITLFFFSPRIKVYVEKIDVYYYNIRI